MFSSKHVGFVFFFHLPTFLRSFRAVRSTSQTTVLLFEKSEVCQIEIGWVFSLPFTPIFRDFTQTNLTTMELKRRAWILFQERQMNFFFNTFCEVDLKSFSSAQWEEEFSCREKAKSTISFILVIKVRKPYSEVQCDRSMTQGKHLSPSFRVHSSFPNGLIRMMLELVLCLLPTVSYSSFSTTLLFQTCMV